MGLYVVKFPEEIESALYDNTSEILENGIEFSRSSNRKRLILDIQYDSYGHIKEVNSSHLDGTPYQQLIFREGKIDSYHNY